jgi:hypothetical protein
MKINARTKKAMTGKRWHKWLEQTEKHPIKLRGNIKAPVTSKEADVPDALKGM